MQHFPDDRIHIFHNALYTDIDFPVYRFYYREWQETANSEGELILIHHCLKSFYINSDN